MPNARQKTKDRDVLALKHRCHSGDQRRLSLLFLFLSLLFADGDFPGDFLLLLLSVRATPSACFGMGEPSSLKAILLNTTAFEPEAALSTAPPGEGIKVAASSVATFAVEGVFWCWCWCWRSEEDAPEATTEEDVARGECGDAAV